MRLKNWVFCSADAINGRELVVQVNDDTCIGLTGSGRIIIARCRAGEVGQIWTGGEFHGEPEGVAYAYLGTDGSEVFAQSIGATKKTPENRFQVCPQLPHHQFTEYATAMLHPGMTVAMVNAITKGDGNFQLAKILLGVMETVAEFARSTYGWHYSNLED